MPRLQPPHHHLVGATMLDLQRTRRMNPLAVIADFAATVALYWLTGHLTENWMHRRAGRRPDPTRSALIEQGKPQAAPQFLGAPSYVKASGYKVVAWGGTIDPLVPALVHAFGDDPLRHRSDPTKLHEQWQRLIDTGIVTPNQVREGAGIILPPVLRCPPEDEVSTDFREAANRER